MLLTKLVRSGQGVGKEIDIGRTLANLPLFQQLRESEINKLAAGTCEIRLSKGQILFQKGTLLDSFYAVASGQIKLAFSSPQGNQKVVSIVGPDARGWASDMHDQQRCPAGAPRLHPLVVHKENHWFPGRCD